MNTWFIENGKIRDRRFEFFGLAYTSEMNQMSSDEIQFLVDSLINSSIKTERNYTISSFDLNAIKQAVKEAVIDILEDKKLLSQ